MPRSSLLGGFLLFLITCDAVPVHDDENPLIAWTTTDAPSLHDIFKSIPPSEPQTTHSILPVTVAPTAVAATSSQGLRLSSPHRPTDFGGTLDTYRTPHSDSPDNWSDFSLEYDFSQLSEMHQILADWTYTRGTSEELENVNREIPQPTTRLQSAPQETQTSQNENLGYSQTSSRIPTDSPDDLSAYFWNEHEFNQLRELHQMLEDSTGLESAPEELAADHNRKTSNPTTTRQSSPPETQARQTKNLGYIQTSSRIAKIPSTQMIRAPSMFDSSINLQRDWQVFASTLRSNPTHKRKSKLRANPNKSRSQGRIETTPSMINSEKFINDPHYSPKEKADFSSEGTAKKTPPRFLKSLEIQLKHSMRETYLCTLINNESLQPRLQPRLPCIDEEGSLIKVHSGAFSIEDPSTFDSYKIAK
ncbi:hypothetical protein PCASD_20982 [Puccinia coronata f. sp. avenae]|uniref:Uncharacterized protein n=1 Tax=Puccinia coronata f. sp. avenae TaxID=200324 RepID=A0A2N5SID3_9BASI|nr:hypothetical protein PCASD_20982 [Puccinia coronata f. sp. avenae]